MQCFRHFLGFMCLVTLTAGVITGAQQASTGSSADPAKHWTADNGNGTYTNPLFYEEFEDPDVIRVGEDYYLAGTTMHMNPAVQIMHSKDLVNWELVGYCTDKLDLGPAYRLEGGNIYGRGIWAPCIRYHNGMFYIFSNVNNAGLQVFRSKSIKGPWERNQLPGRHDLSVLFDDDGKVYIISGGGAPYPIEELNPNLRSFKTDAPKRSLPEKMGEGHHLYKINGKYYDISAIPGATTDQMVARADSIDGPWTVERMVQGESLGVPVSTPASVTTSDRGLTLHQGSIVDTPSGEWWSIIMSDHGSAGRMVNLVPITWDEGFPLIGLPGNLRKAPNTWIKPNTGYTQNPKPSFIHDDNFDSGKLNPHWQWNHVADDSKWSLTEKAGVLRLHALPANDFYSARNTLCQRPPAPESIMTIELETSGMVTGDIAGLALLSSPDAWIGVVKSEEGMKLQMRDNTGAVGRRRSGSFGGQPAPAPAPSGKITTSPTVPPTHLWLRVACNFDTDLATFSWSADGKQFNQLGDPYKMTFQLRTFQGVRPGLSCFNTSGKEGGYVDFDNYVVDEPRARGIEREIPMGKTIVLTSGADGSFLAADTQNNTLVNMTAADKTPDNAKFQVVDLGLGRVALKASNGKFVSITDKEHVVLKDLGNTKPGDAESFQWVNFVRNDIMLMTLTNHQYLATKPNTPGPVTANALGVTAGRKSGAELKWKVVQAAPPRPEGPCDIYAAAGCPCVAAHSTTRALYASYNGPLYQVMRQSDGKTLDIGVVQLSEGDAGGYADAAAQDAFSANTYCWITTIYDQSGQGNHLVQAPRGGFSGPAMGGFNNIPIADMAPVTLMGHKAYGVFIEPGMGLRWNDAKGTAVDDQAEGQYWVISGHHYNSGCCFDYGNAETDSRDDGDGTMETTYYGNASAWYRGQAPGPWIMTDQENNLVGCVNQSPNDKYCADLPSIAWRFVTATADGEPHHWRSMGGDAQRGDLEVMFDGPRVKNGRSSYDPMRKQGAILLGNGGDNSNSSQGTFYEGAMTAPDTFPTQETNQKIQANIVAAKYDVQRLSIAPASATAAPPGLQTFSPGSTQDTTVTFTNTTGMHATNVNLGITVPAGWTAVAKTSATIPGSVAPGQTVSTTFKVTSGPMAFNGDLVGTASWKNTATGQTQSEIAIEKVRNVGPIKINEFAISSGTPANSTSSFIEIYNAGNSAVDISNWTLTQHPTQQPIFSSVKIPAKTKLASKGFYLLGLSNSGLAVPAKKGDTTIYVRSTDGMSVGDTIEIDTGSAVETRKIANIQTPPVAAPTSGRGGFGGGRPGGARGLTTVWQPIPDGPVMTIPAGSTNIPVTSIDGFEVGQKMAIGYGATYPAVAQALEKYEVVTITKVGKPGTQAWLSMDAKAGDTNIKVSSAANISVGDKIRLDIDSVGHGIETVTVTKVGTQSARNTFNGPLREGENPGTGLDLAEPLKFDHASNIPFSARGTGVSFEPATAFDHSSNEPVLALNTSITLNSRLNNDHEINAVVHDKKVTTAGYQGTQKPNQWFGGPALSNAGNMVLRDAAGLVVDSLNYGGLVDPWATEGYQAASGAGQGGCSVPAPSAGFGGFGGFGGRSGPNAGSLNRSAGRFPDGTDTDSNCRDFLLQTTTALSIESAVGANNIKVTSVADLSVGQTIIIDSGANRETAVIATVGTAGGTTISAAASVGATVIPVASAAGFSVGQTITIDSGANRETAVVASVSGGRGGFGGGRGGPGGGSITVSSPLTIAHAAGAQVSGSGITLAGALTKAHTNGAQVTDNEPTPGMPNKYSRRPQ